MKAFRFSLDSALRWRASQLEIRQNRASASAAKLHSIQSAIELRRREISSGGANLARGASGALLQSWAAWEKRCMREIEDLGRHAETARQALAADVQAVVTANRDMRLLDKLKQTAHTNWVREADQELEAFATESFLRQVTIRKRAGA